MKKDEESAFPILGSENKLGKYTGMSKRFFAACMVLQGLVQRRNIPPAYLSGFDDVIHEDVQTAYKYATKLLKQESNDLGENQ